MLFGRARKRAIGSACRVGVSPASKTLFSTTFLCSSLLIGSHAFLPMVAHAEGCAITTGTEVVCAADDLTGFQTEGGASSVTINAGVKLGNVDAEFGVVEGEEGLIFVGTGTIVVHQGIDGDLTNNGIIADQVDMTGIATNKIAGDFINTGLVEAAFDAVHVSSIPFVFEAMPSTTVARSVNVDPTTTSVRIEFGTNDVHFSAPDGSIGFVIPSRAPIVEFEPFEASTEKLTLLSNVTRFENSGTISARIGTAVAVGGVGGDFVNATSGKINGGFRGLLVGGVSGNVINHGTITGVSTAVDLLIGNKDFTNSGTIIGGAPSNNSRFRDGTSYEYISPSDGVNVQHYLSGNFENEATGTITGTRDAVHIEALGGRFYNAGSIKGNSGVGVFLGSDHLPDVDGAIPTNTIIGSLSADAGSGTTETEPSTAVDPDSRLSITTSTGTGTTAIRVSASSGVVPEINNEFINAVSGTIEGATGVQIKRTSRNVVNSGSITGLDGAGLLIGSADQSSSVPILDLARAGSTGIIVAGSATASSPTDQAFVPLVSIDNASTGLITGKTGILVNEASTSTRKGSFVTNAGTISGSDGVAI